jgi:hypothetical protein
VDPRGRVPSDYGIAKLNDLSGGEFHVLMDERTVRQGWTAGQL